MKQPKRLTRDQKILISEKGINPAEFVLVSENKNDLLLRDKVTGTLVSVPKKVRK